LRGDDKKKERSCDYVLWIVSYVETGCLMICARNCMR